MYVGVKRKDSAQKLRMISAALQIMENEVSCLDPRLVQESQHLIPHVKRSLFQACDETESYFIKKKGDEGPIKNWFFQRSILRIKSDITWWRNNWRSRLLLK
jgi:hypothetical protein